MDREEQRLARKARRQQAKRGRILDEARRLLEEGGPTALTMSALAEAADTSTPTLYYYFASKEAVADALAIQLLEEETGVMMAALESASGGVASVVAIMEARLRHYVAHPAAFRVLYLAMMDVGISQATLEQHVYPLSARVMRELEDRLRADQAAGRVHASLRPREFANVAFFTVQGILATLIGMAQSGGTLRFGAEVLLAEAVATVRRAATPPGSPSGS